MQAIAQECKVVNILPPKDISAAAHSAAYVNTENYQHATFIVQMGATGATGSSKNITFTQGASVSGTTSANLPIVNYWTNGTAAASASIANDVFAKQTAVASSGNTLALTASTDNIVYIFEFDTRELTDGYPFIGVGVATVSAATLCGVTAILSNARYPQALPPSALS